ncbi:glucose 1-dehydrogenase [Acidovorax sp. SUPP2522]|uniref:SDR family NAD(P)-dependent oxidoreductase n=1 Tax=unclassified Acidovorax TaxID=2684926 RepID=UPI00234B243E|nr:MULTISPECIES: glucose 1-dehydrogenase [unclassified Acidovorax]WCM97693.1 glucose 1-dehydrogenase [Acidovorax sp. GBBC 1281]GKT13296.1 glucose 1-dehydrogenase [Acidovorax sp. SUPP2522]
MPAHALPLNWPATPGLLAGRLALVTGAASGIGRAVAVAFAQAGARVIVTDLQAERCADTLRDVRAAGTEGWAWALDVSSAQACHDLATQVAQSVGDVDTLVNNAGVIIREGIDSPRAAENLRRTMDVNLFGVFHTVHAWLPALRRTRGSIINVASGAAFIAQGGALGYSPSKAAVKMFTQTLALDLAPDGIRVNALAPGVIDTPMTEATRANPERLARFMQRIPAGRLGQPHELAGPAVFLASDMASFVNGVTLPVDGGTLAV